MSRYYDWLRINIFFTASSRMFLSKAEFYLKGDIDSIKQYIMLRNADNWDVKAIQDHQKEIFQLLKTF